MRKCSGFLLAASILLPATFIAAAPAGAAAGLTCKAISGKVTWTPPVPAAPTMKVSNTTLAATFAGCSGTPGVTKGTVKVPTIVGKTKQNCTTLFAKPTKITVPKGGTITWNKGAKSTLGVLTLTPTKLAAQYKAVVRVSAGQFVDKSVTMTSVLKPNGCPLSSAALSLPKGTKVTIK